MIHSGSRWWGRLTVPSVRCQRPAHVRDAPLLAHCWDGIIRLESDKLQTPTQTLIAEWDYWFRSTAGT